MPIKLNKISVKANKQLLIMFVKTLSNIKIKLTKLEINHCKQLSAGKINFFQKERQILGNIPIKFRKALRNIKVMRQRGYQI
jgi:hypothetical protein